MTNALVAKHGSVNRNGGQSEAHDKKHVRRSINNTKPSRTRIMSPQSIVGCRSLRL